MNYTYLLRIFIISLFCSVKASAQVTGGQYAMEFLRLSNSAKISALGGINVANLDQDISLGIQNPSLFRPAMHNQLALGYNSYYAGINIANLVYGSHSEKLNTTFGYGISFLDYGSIPATNDIGTIIGEVKAQDFVVSASASRSYGEHWRYGATLKFAFSNLTPYNSAAILGDIGVTYIDTASLLSIGIVAKNIGAVVQKYRPENPAEPLPFDLQLGISKQFKHLPLRLFITLHHLYRWDIRYNNPADIYRSTLVGADTSDLNKKYFGDKLFRHFIFGGELTFAKRLSVTVAYNHLRRGEMVIKDKTALAGFSFGASVYLNKFQIHYARSFYSLAGAYNEFGLNMALNRLIGSGKSSDKSNWNKIYNDYF